MRVSDYFLHFPHLPFEICVMPSVSEMTVKYITILLFTVLDSQYYTLFTVLYKYITSICRYYIFTISTCYKVINSWRECYYSINHFSEKKYLLVH